MMQHRAAAEIEAHEVRRDEAKHCGLVVGDRAMATGVFEIAHLRSGAYMSVV